MRKFLLLTCMCLTIPWFGVLAQNASVSGRVTSSDDGTPLPGVNVIVKGTVNGTVTDSDGKFTLPVSSTTGTLVFSFIGLTSQEIEINGRSTIDVIMSEDVTQLGEVVVTAQGNVRETK